MKNMGAFMQQTDLFRSNTEDFLYGEIQKVRHSMDKRSRAMFSLITELQDQLLQLKEKERK